MNRSFSTFCTLLLALQSSSFLSGCANSIGTVDDPKLAVPVGSYQIRTSSDGTDENSEDSGFDCPTELNVTPDYDWNTNGSGYFRICASKTSAYEILIHSQINSSSTICVFPAQYTDDEHIPAQQNLTDSQGRPLQHCTKLQEGSTRLVFDKAIFNSVFIVEYPDRDQMVTCLAYNNTNICPKNFSYGHFRN